MTVRFDLLSARVALKVHARRHVANPKNYLVAVADAMPQATSDLSANM
jgi:hypothetical protein